MSHTSAVALTLLLASAALAGEGDFAASLHPKFQVKGCTSCHDFFEKARKGLSYGGHRSRTPA